MVFREIKKAGVKNGMKECKRVLSSDGQIIISVLHPEFVEVQIKRGVIKNNLMISAEGFKTPVVKRKLSEYREALENADIKYNFENVYGNQVLYNTKPKLKEIKEVPIALIITGTLNQ
jgi:hypothetical protein